MTDSSALSALSRRDLLALGGAAAAAAGLTRLRWRQVRRTRPLAAPPALARTFTGRLQRARR